MEYSVLNHNDHMEVALQHQFTFNDNAKFRNLIGLLQDQAPASLTLELSKLDFIDSAGLGMLLLLHDETSKRSITVTLQHPKGQIRKMLELSNFGQLFTIAY